MRRKALLVNVDYVVRNGQTYARLFVKGKKASTLYYPYDPYFYVDAEEGRAQAIYDTVVKAKDGAVVSPKRVETEERELGGEKKKLLKVFCNEPRHVPILEEAMGDPCYEYKIPYGRRFMMDFGLVPLSVVRYERQGRIIKEFLGTSEGDPYSLNRLAFDIETYNPEGAPRTSRDPIIMLSYRDSAGKEGVLSWKAAEGEFVEEVEGEKGLLERFFSVLSEADADVLLGYNSNNFDLPYIAERAKRLGVLPAFGRDGKGFREAKKGLLTAYKMRGRVNVDLYPVMKFFGFTGLIRTDDYTLANVYAASTGKKKKMVERLDIWKMWDEGELKELAQYSMEDARATYELGELAYPILSELSPIARLPLFDAAYATSGQLVESLLMYEAAQKGMVIPPRPSGSAVNARISNPIKGAYVKLPAPGVYENIAVFDFRGLYPSIICSYNIDPDRLDQEGEGSESPTGARFLKKPRGLIPEVLEGIIDRRVKIKRELKGMKPEGKEYTLLSARSHALKILANSFYGYLGYARSRWYNRKCAESVTAWGRQHIREAEKKAEEAGFKVLYMDTDSLFLLLGEKSRGDALAFLDGINRELPEKMELELEGFYTSGVFVSKKSAELGAKKKYALLGEDGRIKIKGFELVRRDWSSIAKDTQRRVLETILKEGSREKAAAIVRDVISDLKGGKVPLKELAIYTQLKKAPEQYEVKSPELFAAEKARKKGKRVGKGSIINYVITRNGKSISEKAEMLEYAKDYDPDYYVNNQVLPAVLKILKELGYDEYALKHGGRQQDLNSFF